MGTQTGTAITYEDLMNIVVEMTYQRAKPLLEEYVRVRNERIETIAEMVACLVQEVEAMCGITHDQDEGADEDEAEDTSGDETEWDEVEDNTDPEESEEPDEDEIIPAD